MLVIGGVGLPLWPYKMNSADGAAVLERVKRMARAAGRVQYQAPGQVLKNVVSVDTPGSFARYGRTCIGWVVPDSDRVLNLSALPRGKYRVRFFDPGQDVQVSQTEIWATGESARVELPQNLKAVYVQAEPMGGGEPAAAPTRHTRHAERHTYVAPRPRPRPEPVHVSKHKPTRAELRHQRALEKKEAARKAAEARKKKPKKLTRAELRHQKALEKKEAARKAAEAKKHKPKKLTRAEIRHQKALEKKAKKHDSTKRKPTKKELAAKKKADAKKKAAAKKKTVPVKKKRRR
jgi:hypothetical protein